MDEDYELLFIADDVLHTEIFGCSRCGVLVFDKAKHESLAHPVAMPFDGEDDVDLDDDIPEDDELPEEPEEPTQPTQPTPEVVVINPNGS